MKNLTLFGLLSLMSLGLAALPALAVDLPPGVNELKFGDHSTLFSDQDPGDADLEPEGLGDTVNNGDEQRTISRVSTIEHLDTGDFVFGPSSPTELTGMLYELEVLNQTVSPSGSLIIDFGGAGRNPLTTDNDLDSTGPDGVYGTADDPVDPSDGTAITFGGVFEIYEDPAKNFSANPGGVASGQSKLPGSPPIALDAGNGPSFWTEGGAGHVPGGAADTYPGASDGTLWLAGSLVELDYLANVGVLPSPGQPYATGTVLRETIDLGSGVGSGFAHMNVAGGAYAHRIERGSLGPLVDLAFTFNLDFPAITDNDGSTLPAGGSTISGDETASDTPSYVGQGQWQVDSEDPALFSTTLLVPEPGTMSLLGLALCGLIGLRGRKK